jgi:hypothetical protein
MSAKKFFPLSLVSCIVLLLTLFLFQGSAAAVDIRASTTVIYTGQSVTFTVTSTHSPGLIGPNCTMEVLFGDGSRQTLPVCNSLSCTASTSHTYNRAGTYIATARPLSGCPNLNPPTSDTVTITVRDRIQQVTLPDGVVGLDYSYRLGEASSSYTLVQGQTDPGLRITGNYLQGIPQQEASYRFQVRKTEASGLITLIWYKLKINRARLTVTISPAQNHYDAAHPAPIALTYNGQSTAPLNDTLTSNRGVFRAGNTIIGTVATALSAPLTRGSARFNESLTIPATVIDRAQQLGIDLILFQRSFSSNFMDPADAQTEISLTFAPREITLPDGFTGVSYSYSLGDSGNNYRLVSGQMPPGLKLENNLIKGIPEAEGNYRFQIEESRTLRSRASPLTWYNLRISKSRLLVTTSPSQVTVSRNRPESFRLTYSFRSSAGLNDTLSSTTGIFLANGTEIGRINQPLAITMYAGQAQFEETVTIPLAVLKTAERQGLSRLQYQRTFTARYLDATTTGTTAVTVGTGFTFTKIKLYFTDKSSKKFVKRNARDIGAQVELRYEGAGVLKGYWQADNRILSLVTMDLPFAKDRTIILTLPPTPPLPTFAQGSHRLRFVITEPPMDIAFPQIIYIVSGEDLSQLHPIQLLTPADRESLPATDKLSFSWEPKTGIAVYRLEIFADDTPPDTPARDDNVLFSAYCKKPLYTVPDIVRQNKFSDSGSYRWRVTGFDQENHPIARSRERRFLLGQRTRLDYVPRRLLLAFDGSDAPDDIKARLERLSKRYHLSLESRKKLVHLGLELLTFSTPDRVAAVRREIAAEMPQTAVQPDYYYITSGTVAETYNLGRIRRRLQPLRASGDGDGVRIAVIDTGVDLDLEDLAPNLVAHANYVEGSTYRAEIHGTAVASIIAARRDHRGCAGIAPQSKLIALRACYQIAPGRAPGRGSTSSLLQALDGALENRAAIINLSLGGPQTDPLLAKALEQSAAA